MPTSEFGHADHAGRSEATRPDFFHITHRLLLLTVSTNSRCLAGFWQLDADQPGGQPRKQASGWPVERFGGGREVFLSPLLVALRTDFAHRFAFELELVGVVNQAIEDRVGNGRTGDQVMPAIDGHLARDDRAVTLGPILEDL